MAKEVVKANAEAKKEEVAVSDIPDVKVTSRGRVSRGLEFLGKAYEARFDGQRVVRWVWAPLHKPELSNIVGRRMDGWKMCLASELPEAKEMLDLTGEVPVRNGDLVLMWTSPENQAALRKENIDKAKDQARTIESEYYEKTKKASAGDKMRPEHELRPRGRSIIEEREFETAYEHTTQQERESGG